MSTDGGHLAEDLTSRARIRNAALTLFASYGAAGTSLRAIAAQAGVTVGLIPHHFGSKDGLRTEVENWVVKQFETAIAAANELAGPRGATAAQRDAQVARMLAAQPVVVDYLRRELFYPSAGSRLLAGLLGLAENGVDEMRALGLISLKRPRSEQVVDALIRQLGRLFIQPLVDRAYAQVAGSAQAPQVVVELNKN